MYLFSFFPVCPDCVSIKIVKNQITGGSAWRQTSGGEKLCHPSHSTAIHHSNPDVLASPLAGGFICQQYTGATYSSCLFSPLTDVSTSSGMHSSCPSFAHVTNVCLAVCKIRSLIFFFQSFDFFSPFFFFLSLKKKKALQQTQGRGQTRALCFLLWFN